MIYRLELPQTGGDGAVQDFLEDWISQPSLRRIVEAAGGEWPRGSLLERTETLHDFSDRWNFRRGGERLEIGLAEIGIDDDETVAVAAELGMTEARTPSEGRYDHVLVLGGTALASINRLRRLYELEVDGSLAVDRIAVLTALREVANTEIELVEAQPELAPIVVGKPSTEFGVMVEATKFFSGSDGEITQEENPNPHLSSARAQVGNALVLAAPSADPSRRANTRDNYDVYSAEIGPSDSVLVITSSIYLPYQFFIALQALGWERPRTIEAVGFPPEWMGGVLTGPKNVLQELRSAFFGALNTARRLDAGR